MTLVALIAIPLVAGLLSWQSGRYSRAAPRWIALAAMVIALGFSLWLWLTHDYSFTGAGFSAASTGIPQWTLEYRVAWIPAFGASFHLGLDGLSLLLIVLTNLLGLFAVVSSWRDIDRDAGFFHLNLLLNLAGVVGVFLALDLLLFFFFWEMMLVPMYFLIALWGYDAPGGKTRTYAAIKFVIYTQASGLLLLIAILALAYAHVQATGVLTFDYHDLLGTPMGASVEWLLMLGFFIAFAVKMPIVPLHGWLPDAHTNAPVGASVDLAGILLKTAAYGLLRFGIPLFPHAAADIAPLAMWLGVAGVVYGAVVAFSQTDIKRLVAYTSISHMGFIVIGLYAGTEQALIGIVVQMIAHGLSAGALFILCGEIQERLGTRDLRQMGGLWSRLPNLPPLLLFFAVATLGLPGLGNFVGEFLILSGAFVVAPWVTVAASSGLILAVVYSLIMVQRALQGPAAGVVLSPPTSLVDLSMRELAMLVSLVVLLIGLGLYPQPVIDAAVAPMDAFEAIYVDVEPAPNPCGRRPVNATAMALMPLLVTAATVVVAMLTIALRRDHRLTVGVTFAGVALAFLSLVPSAIAEDSAAIQIGELLLVDGVARFAMALILLTTLAVLTLCPPYVNGYRGNREELYLLIGVGTVGGLTLACASHAATLLLGLELLGLPMVGAVAYGVDRPRSIEGGVKYLVLSAAASATLLFGIALIYAQYGALGMSTLATAMAGAGGGSPLVTAGAFMVLAGLAFKLSFVPFHQWTPDVYEAAPVPVTAYLATVVKLGAFVAALRILHAGTAGASPLIVSAIVVLALASMVIGSLLALRQTNLKRLLAYSSIANFGFLAVLLAIPGLLAVRAAGIYLVGYLVTSLGVFGVMTVVSSPMGRRDLEDLDEYRGLFWHRPYLAAILIAMLLSLAGIPFTAGFIGKLAVIGVGVRASQWWLVGGIALASAIGIFYYLRIINALLSAAEPGTARALAGWMPRFGALVLLAAAIATVWLGVLPQPLFLIGRNLVFP